MIKLIKTLFILVIILIVAQIYSFQQIVLLNQSLDEAYYKLNKIRLQLDKTPIVYNDKAVNKTKSTC